jgi:hypothetical protein
VSPYLKGKERNIEDIEARHKKEEEKKLVKMALERRNQKVKL